jgi:Zn-finger nucleic acid-binding protein
MTDPYRDAQTLACPACSAALREFNGRLCCDACGGVMLPLADLTAAIADDVGAQPVLGFIDHGKWTRKCPRCGEIMHASRLTAAVGELHEKLKPQLDRCLVHGVWFDNEELAKVLELVHKDLLPRGYPSLLDFAEALGSSRYGPSDWAPKRPK